MYDYLLDAESQLGSDTVEDNVADCSQDGGSAVPVAAGAGDTNICGGIVQLYWNHILERCLDTNEQIRQSALKVTTTVMGEIQYNLFLLYHITFKEVDRIIMD